MFTKMKNWYNSRRLKLYSTTLTTATNGEQSKKDLNPEIKALMENVTSHGKISISEASILFKYFLNVPTIDSTLYKFRNNTVAGMVFVISRVVTIFDENGDIVDGTIELNELVYGCTLIISISVKEFHEFLEPIPPIKNPNKEKQPC